VAINISEGTAGAARSPDFRIAAGIAAETRTALDVASACRSRREGSARD